MTYPNASLTAGLFCGQNLANGTNQDTNGPNRLANSRNYPSNSQNRPSNRTKQAVFLEISEKRTHRAKRKSREVQNQRGRNRILYPIAPLVVKMLLYSVGSPRVCASRCNKNQPNSKAIGFIDRFTCKGRLVRYAHGLSRKGGFFWCCNAITHKWPCKAF